MGYFLINRILCTTVVGFFARWSKLFVNIVSPHTHISPGRRRNGNGCRSKRNRPLFSSGISNCSTWSNCENPRAALGLFFILNCRMSVGKVKCIGKTRPGAADPVQGSATEYQMSERIFHSAIFIGRCVCVCSDTIIIITVILRAEWLPITDKRKLRRPRTAAYVPVYFI